MPNGFLNISHNFAGESQFIVVEWVKSTAQGTPVVGHVTGTGLGVQNDTDATQVYYPAPHVNQQLQVINISEAWHLVRFWRSSDGTAKDVLLLELAGNASTGALFPIQRYEYVVGRGYNNTTPIATDGIWSDPEEGDIGIRDTRLFEKSFWVEERGLGSLLTAEITVRDDEGGGFDFVDALKQMFEGGVYIITAINKVQSTGEDSGIIIDDDDVYILTGDDTFDPVTMGGRTIIADSPSAVITLDIADLASHPDSSFELQTHEGTQRNVVINLLGGTVNFRQNSVTKIILGRGEFIKVLIKDNAMYIRDSETNHERLGEVSYSYKKSLNSIPADGTLLALADYPRVEELLDSLPASSIVTQTVWDTTTTETDGQVVYLNRGKWMREGSNFRTPRLTGLMLKGLDAVDESIASGRYEHQRVLNHDHYITGGADNSEDGTYLAESHSTGGNLGYNLYGSTQAPSKHKVGLPILASDSTQKVNNIGLYPNIMI